MLGQGLLDPGNNVAKPDSPAVRAGVTAHSVELIRLQRAGVGGGHDGPRAAVPMIGEGLARLIEIPCQGKPHGPAIRGADTCHSGKLVVYETRTIRGDDGPGAAIPVLG